MLKALEDELNVDKQQQIQTLAARNTLTDDALTRILTRRVRVENVLVKDTKMRTFIASDTDRDRMAAHVYDITYGTVRPGLDRLVAIDDSIVRGTTLRQSILRIIARLQPKQVVIVSSAPQIRYPDCYGIDMSQIERFLVFQAAIELLKERGQQQVLNATYKRCVAAREAGTLEHENLVRALYEPFSDEELSAKCAELLQPAIPCPLTMVFQTVPNLHTACPHHRGDWYFTGHFPTPGGNRVTNTAFLNWMEGRQGRAY
jgi:amidophosphoribosyltransferase